MTHEKQWFHCEMRPADMDSELLKTTDIFDLTDFDLEVNFTVGYINVFPE